MASRASGVELNDLKKWNESENMKANE